MNLEPNAVIPVKAIIQPVAKGFTDKDGYSMYENMFEIYVDSGIGVWFMSQIVEGKKND